MAENIKVIKIQADPVATFGDTIKYGIDLNNGGKSPLTVNISLDIYPAVRPSDPKRHLGWWNSLVKLPAGDSRLEIVLSLNGADFAIGESPRPADDLWLGDFREDGLYDVNVVVYDGQTAGSAVLDKKTRSQIILFSNNNAEAAIGWAWPEAVRRTPPLYMPDYVTLSSIASCYRSAVAGLGDTQPDLLDVGCGMKPYYPLFHGRVASYTGLDIIDNGVSDVLGESNKLPFADGSFGVVISSQVLEHVIDPFGTVKEMFRVLKPGGTAIVSIPFIWEEHHVPTDFWRFTSDGARELFADFSDIEVAANGTSFQSLIQQTNLYIQGTFQKDRLTWWKKAWFVWNNLFARATGVFTKDIKMTPNYTIVARKSAISEKGRG